MLGMDPEVSNYMNERSEKQTYLKTEIQDKYYNVAEFAQYLEWKRGKSEGKSSKARVFIHAFLFCSRSNCSV